MPDHAAAAPILEVRDAVAVDDATLAAAKARQSRQRQVAATTHARRIPKPPPSSRYTIGIGDILSIGIHGQPDSIKEKVPVAPDGSLSYLQARGIAANGLTVAQLRARLQDALRNFHRDPKVIINPVELGSKHFTVLGQVRDNGVYPLNRPTTLLEAIAGSGGIRTGLTGEYSTELADFQRSFVMRRTERLPVNMEALYHHGDLTQNIYVLPDDYIYIASNLHNEVYVLGALNRPGTVTLDSRMSVTGAIAGAGGFNEKGWAERVLVVRGSLSDPQTYAINVGGIVRGNKLDFEVKPGDIVYVHNRPWTVVEDLLDVAIKVFIQGSTASALSDNNAVSIGL